jgi:hypothetical protein
MPANKRLNPSGGSAEIEINVLGRRRVNRSVMNDRYCSRDIRRKMGNDWFWSILLKNPVSASSEKFLAAMRGFVISDMRGHKKYPGSRQRSSYRLITQDLNRTFEKNEFWLEFSLIKFSSFSTE